ncbi:hypothetical protein BSKO_13806 [Bryopsis sp. KO-2023]|nr:hypothetical protein BSKO_13806 [Bryopsis sp. KO-2023]
MSTEERNKMAKTLGYRQIGKPVPENVTVVDVIKTFPKEVYELDHSRAWSALFLTVSGMVLGFTCVAVSPWYLLPFAWFLAGTASTGLFVLGHDCGHGVFHEKKWVNDIIGHLVLTPLIYPFEPWRIMHNLHHLHTNKLHKDTGWHPLSVEEAVEHGPVVYNIIKIFMGSPLRLFLSIVHWVKLHFNPAGFTPKQLKKVCVSWAVCLAFAVGMWTWLTVTMGFWDGWFKFWFMPWIGYHFWMSTFTLVHHTAPHIPFRSEENYHGAQAKLGGTVHCDFPKWIQVMCHNINVHVPHHLSVKIPFYHLEAATDSLRKNWGQYMTEGTINWRMMRNFLTEIHLYEFEKEYVPFDAGKAREDPLLAVQRRLYPDTI